MIKFLNPEDSGLDVGGSASDGKLSFSFVHAENFDSVERRSLGFPDHPSDFPLVLIPGASLNFALVSVDLMPSNKRVFNSGVFGADSHTTHLTSRVK